MHLEVEQKFRVPDHEPLRGRLHELGAARMGTVVQADRYFAHPASDFAQTDEALRLRQVGDENWITYKGPRIDSHTKTRRELELPLAPGPLSLDQYAELLVAVGFRPVATVQKTRERWRLVYPGSVTHESADRSCAVEIALDTVERVGLFVELEATVAEEGKSLAYEAIDSLANNLTLSRIERRSYLELLLETSP
jgi:adenylate cyclase class 2